MCLRFLTEVVFYFAICYSRKQNKNRNGTTKGNRIIKRYATNAWLS